MTIASEPTPFGKPMLKYWAFDPSYKNLNNGSFGAHPLPVRDVHRAFLDLADKRPDTYIRKLHADYLEQARIEVAEVINAPKDECVFVKNATTGVYTVLYNLKFQADETAILFDGVYGAVEKGAVSLQEHGTLKYRKVKFTYPIGEDELEKRFREVVRKAREEGLKVKAAVFDIIVSNPGLRFPFERFIRVCREEGILSVIDGAHGIGHIKLDMSILQPDFFVSNCHKWLYTPRSCAVLYVPKRNQHHLRSTVPTSWGFIAGDASPATGASVLKDPSSPQKTPFEELFEFVATTDDSPYVCVPAALKFRREVCGGEDAIIAYNEKLANEAGDAVAKILATEVLQEPDLKPGEVSNMRRCAMSTVRLPIAVADGTDPVPGAMATISVDEASRAFAFIQRTLMQEYDTFVPTFQHGPWLWTRLSAQTWLEKSDFEWLGGVLHELCGRIARKEY
ncbi:hypothetical protein N7468_007201 [Penicillium chermesinum]|uniref:Aminotransferase class V domain-containing protein n=1 Tax=Penicillium chermesinum TaxID=63820 RepID=A0A9W9NTN1_9EURO|nr:uncharacterized protein N7468_007201 [Penicillium chermesinum]KAJ5225976.1 hypothetical protein N7468_007201 [Penicillium chermesinum]KAJ6160823.1 hypothetical protein N7470_004219 [Penicillium chermesinum]